jgi:hypothetical protein
VVEELQASPEEIAPAQIAIERARADDFGSSRMLAPERRRDRALAIEGALLHEPEAWEDEA